MSFSTYRGYYESDEYSYPITNILNVSNPESYKCEITAFQKTHSVLTIHCDSRDENVSIPAFKLQFHLFSYIELLPRWHGLDIEVASPEECFEILSQTRNGVGQWGEETVKQHILFKFKSIPHDLKVIANSLTAYPLHNKEDYLKSLE